MKTLYISLLLTCSLASAQSFQWVQTPPINLSLNPDLVGYCVAADANGNVYSAGFQDNAYSYGDIFGKVFFNKYDSSGTVVFSKVFDGHVSVYDMAVDPSGNVIMAIGYVTTITIGDSSITTSAQGIRPLLVKFTANGEMLWNVTPMIGTESAGFFHAITVDSAGNIFAGYDNFSSSYIEKFSADGVHLMTLTQQDANLLNSIDVDNDGNIYAAGSCAGPNATFNGVSSPTPPTYNTWVVKYSANGVFQWTRYVDDITCSRPMVRASTPDNVYFSSYLYGAYNFGNLVAEGPMSGLFSDFFITKLNSTGEFQWVREVPGVGYVHTGNRQYLDIDSEGNAIFVGLTRGTINWTGSVSTTAQGTSADAFLLKFDPAGNVVLAKTAGGISDDRVDAVSISNGGIFISGMARANSSFDELTHDSAGTSAYPYIAKLGNALSLPEANLSDFKIWPNPNAGTLYISGAALNRHFDITDASGKTVLSGKIRNEPIDISGLAAGAYMFNIEKMSAQRLIKK